MRTTYFLLNPLLINLVEIFNVIYNSQINKWCDISFHHLDFRKINSMDLQTSSPKLFNKESYLSIL